MQLVAHEEYFHPQHHRSEAGTAREAGAGRESGEPESPRYTILISALSWLMSGVQKGNRTPNTSYPIFTMTKKHVGCCGRLSHRNTSKH